MICPKCGTENKSNCCIRCGTMLNGDDVIQIKDTRKNNTDIHDDLVLFIGEKADSILNNRINIFAAIFSILWFLYRKSYFLAFVLLFIQSLILLLFVLFIPKVPIFIILVIFCLFYLFFGNTLYIVDASRKIRKIKSKNTSYFNILRKKGGTSIIGIILFIIINILVFILIKPSLKYLHNTYDLFFYMPLWEKDNITTNYRKDNCYAQIGELNEQGRILLYNYYGVKEDFSNLNKEKILGRIWYTNTDEHRKNFNTQLYLSKKNDKTYIAKFFTMDSNSFNSCSKEFRNVKNKLFLK